MTEVTPRFKKKVARIVAPVPDVPAVPLRGTLTETSYEPPADMPFEEWQQAGTLLVRMAESVMWWLGDWWRFGEREYGEAAAQAAPTGFSLATCKNAAWVADRFAQSFRRLNDLSWSHHQAVAALDPADADALLAEALAEDWSHREIRAAKHRRNAGPSPSTVEPALGLFRTVVIDPPWQYDNKATRGAAEDHYPTMSIEELQQVEVPADNDAHLYLWVTNGFMREGLELCDYWGFQYKALLTWVKPQIGTGNYFRNATEHVIFGIRGKLPTLRNDVPTWFKADRTKHSAKPDSFYDIVETSSPGPWIDMFSRSARMGWKTWGNQSLHDDEVAS